MTALALLFTLSAIGISETVYLIRKRIAAQAPVCPIGKDCTVVLTSAYSKLFLVPNDILGLLFYIAAAFVSGVLVVGKMSPDAWMFVFELAAAFGAVFSIFLTYLQWRVIRAWCFWCLMSACTIWLMGIILIVNHFI